VSDLLPAHPLDDVHFLVAQTCALDTGVESNEAAKGHWIALLTMYFSFPKILSNFRYSPLPSSDESNSTRLMIHGASFLQSKRVRLTGALVSIILLLVFFFRRTFLPNGSLENLPGLHQDSHLEPQTNDSVQWSRFAYTQYATNQPYLCNSVMLFEILHRLGSKADRLLMYPSDYQIDDGGLETESFESRLLRKARDEYNVKLQPIQVQRRGGGDRRYTSNGLKDAG